MSTRKRMRRLRAARSRRNGTHGHTRPWTRPRLELSEVEIEAVREHQDAKGVRLTKGSGKGGFVVASLPALFSWAFGIRRKRS